MPPTFAHRSAYDALQAMFPHGLICTAAGHVGSRVIAVRSTRIDRAYICPACWGNPAPTSTEKES